MQDIVSYLRLHGFENHEIIDLIDGIYLLDGIRAQKEEQHGSRHKSSAPNDRQTDGPAQ